MGAHSCLCLPQNQPLSQLVCIELGLWDSPMHSAPLWTVQLHLPEESARALLLHLLLSWDPAYFVLYGSIRYLLTSIQFHLCICCTSSPGDSQRLQKPYTLKLVSKMCLHNRFPKEKRGISQISNICKNLLFFLSTIYSALVILLSILKYQLSCSADSCIISKSSKLELHILICKERFFHKWFFDK